MTDRLDPFSRRSFLAGCGGCRAASSLVPGVVAPVGAASAAVDARVGSAEDLRRFERRRVVRLADQFLREKPVTITARPCQHSPGAIHDYYSEADYFWPKPGNPKGPHSEAHDGMTNPNQFKEHRRALMRFSVQAPALVAAWTLTKDRRYLEHAASHYRAWFVDPATRMNPHLEYSQAKPGVNTGNSYGGIDTVHLIEVARAFRRSESAKLLSVGDSSAVRNWFKSYTEWLTTSRFGIGEGKAPNNHGSGWVLQVAEFASLSGDATPISECRTRLRRLLGEMDDEGGWPRELARTKPYCYSLFQMDLIATACQQLSSEDENFFTLELAGGRNAGRAMSFIYPYIKEKKSWPRPPDVMWFDLWPVRHPCLLFAGLALKRPEYLDLWTRLDPDPQSEEAIRNYPIRQPVLWF